MTKITAAEVNKLRKSTGAGMMDCKKALVESDGDYEKAIDYLRKKGQKLANKRADRDANEGIVIAKVNENKKTGVALMLNCETDFVAKNEDFVNFANKIVDLVIKNDVKTIEEIQSLIMDDNQTVVDSMTTMTGKIGEKLNISKFERIDAESVHAYIHHGSRLATVIGLNKAGVNNVDEIGKDVAMQIAAMNPIALDKEFVDQTIIDREIEIGKDQARQEGKPEELVEKIAIGKLNRFYKENTLLNQQFVKDAKKTVKQYFSENDKELTATSFIRISLGE